jgi:Spy/CpxP family protein refolding chaperone
MHAGPPSRSSEIIVKKLTQELDLTDIQQTQIDKILKDMEPQFRQINQDKRAAMEKVFEDGRLQIRAALNPEQQQKYDDLMQHLRERWNRDHKGRHGEAPPQG